LLELDDPFATPNYTLSVCMSIAATSRAADLAQALAKFSQIEVHGWT
jgi:hypothetical protein